MEVVLPVIAGSISRCTLLKSYQLIMHITPPTPMQERIFFLDRSFLEFFSFTLVKLVLARSPMHQADVD